MILYKNAIVLIMGMKKERIKKAPDIEASKEVWRTYAALSKVAYLLSDVMRKWVAMPPNQIHPSAAANLLPPRPKG